MDTPTLQITTHLDALDAIEQAREQGLDTWEMLVNAAIQDVDDMDTKRWRLGDLSAMVDSRYGEGAMDEFIREIKERKSRIYELRRVALMFPRHDAERASLLELPNLRHSHFSAACRLRDKDAAVALLMQASDEDWTVTQTEYEVAQIRRNGEPRWLTIFDDLVTVVDVGLSDGTVTLKLPVEAVGQFRAGATVKVKASKQDAKR